MKPMITIASAGLCAGLLALASLPALGQEPYDLSKAKEFRTVLKMPMGGSTSGMGYNVDFCGHSGLNVVTTGVSSRGRLTWSTNPKLDTTNLFNWLGINNAVHLKPLDYDGIAPLEYVNSKGIIWRCSMGESPFPLTPVDTAVFGACAGEPELSVDIDGDGYQDVLTSGYGADSTGFAAYYTARIIMGGPQWGKGCNRILTIPRVPRIQTRANVTPRSLYKSSTGRWRLIQQERHPSDLSPWMLIYDVSFVREGDSIKTTFTKLDSLWGGSSSVDDEPFGNVEVLIDTVARRDYFLLQHVVDFDPVVVAVERFDVTEGQFTSTGEKVTGMTFVMNHNLGYDLGTDKPVIAITSSSGTLFCYADNIREPFARWIPTGTGVQPVAGWVVVNDQTGDGKPDILITGGAPSDGNLILISLDPTVSVQDDPQPGTKVPAARLVGDVLDITLSVPAMVSADLVTTDGRMSLALAPVQGHIGQNRYDLTTALRSVPTGAYYLRVRMGDVSRTIPVIR